MAKADTSYPLSQRFSIHYSAYEDRLVLRATLRDGSPLMVLLTRRMVLILLQQILSRLPALAGLEKTPREFWAEVLQLGHQQALQEKTASDAKVAAKAPAQSDTESPRPSTAVDDETDTDPQPAERKPVEHPIWLATDLVIGNIDSGLTMAYKGLRMPGAMVEPSKTAPIVAIPLEVSHLHQLIHLLVEQSRRANWHLPLDLPWLEAPDDKVPDTVITH